MKFEFEHIKVRTVIIYKSNNDMSINQIDELNYTFHFDNRDDVISWLMNECLHQFILYSSIPNERVFNTSTNVTFLTFSDQKGSLEFKLRWL